MASKAAAAATTVTEPKTNPAPEPIKTKAATPKDMLVLDTTAVPTAIDPKGVRIHEQIVDGRIRQFKFEAGQPLALPPEIATKFLQHEAFQLVDEAGNIVAYQRPPKQPGQLGAGEALKFADDEVVARLDELMNGALLKRVMALPGGEQFAAKPDRAKIIAFIVDHKKRTAKANLAKEPDTGPDEFIPDADWDEEAA